MYRYHAILERAGEDEYLFLIDADMLFEGDVGEEILGELVATLHPGYVGKRPSLRDAGALRRRSCRTGTPTTAAGSWAGAGRRSCCWPRGSAAQINHDYDHERHCGLARREPPQPRAVEGEAVRDSAHPLTASRMTRAGIRGWTGWSGRSWRWTRPPRSALDDELLHRDRVSRGG